MASDSYADWRERLADTNDAQFWPIEHIDAELAAGRMQFWPGEGAALITRVVEYPGGAKVLEAITGAGIKAGLTDELESACDAWARANGLTWLFAPGRIGWMRELKPKGWELHHVTMRKDLR